MSSARKTCAALLFCLFLCGGATAQSARTYRNPVIAGDYPDPTVIRVGRDYWAMVTTGGWAPHFTILHSSDLVNWRVAGSVFQKAPHWVKGDFWAPEMIEDRGRFFVFYTARRDEGSKKRGTLCVAVASASAATGPYTDHGPLVCQISELKNVGSIDAFFLRDTDGQPFLVWKADGNDAEPDQPTVIFAQPLSEDFRKLLGKRKEILRNTEPWEKHVTEGSFIIRRGEWFYHFYSGNACCGRACDYALGVARSRKLLGPWEKQKANPILAANEKWQCPGHGSIVTTPEGRDFLLYHAYRKRSDAFNVGREALLDEVTWNETGWPSMNGGRGPSGSAPLPVDPSISSGQPEFFDGFTASQLDASWQWPMRSEQSTQLEASGHLVLAPAAAAAGKPDKVTGAVLAQRTSSGTYVATALVERARAPGATAGIAAYGWREDAVGVAIGVGRVFVWKRDGRDEVMPFTVPAPNSPAVYLRMTVKEGEQFSFAFSVNGREWQQLGGTVNAANVEGARVALTAAGGAARFDWIKIIPALK